MKNNKMKYCEKCGDFLENVSYEYYSCQRCCNEDCAEEYNTKSKIQAKEFLNNKE